MALESGLVSAATRQRLLNGPLLDHIKGFYGWLEEHQFSQRTVQNHLTHVSYLQEHLNARRSEEFDTVNSADIDGFLALHCSASVRWSVHRFVRYLQEKGLYDSTVPPPVYQPLLEGYAQWLGDYRDAAPRTIDTRIEHTRLFLDWLGPQATPEGVSRLTFSQVQDCGAPRRSVGRVSGCAV